MTRYLHGLHVGSWSDHIGDPWTSTGAALMGDRPGVLVFTELVGDGHDYRVWSDGGYTVLVRINYGYGTGGTIPPISQYAEFAQRCAVMVAGSRGVDGWIVGNEPNASFEWPDGVPITAEDYAICFDLCRTAIQITTPSAQVLVAGMAPYNDSSGDWVDYLERVLDGLTLVHQPARQYDGVCIHAYTHGHDPALITSEAMMDPPYHDWHYEFRAYRDFMSVIPDGVPVWVSESNPGADPAHKEWRDIDNGWCWEAYREIDRWNSDHPARQIRGLCLYRYPQIDPWWIVGKTAVEADFVGAVNEGYEWEDATMAAITDGLDYYYPFQDDGHLTCPVNWEPVWLHDPEEGVLDRPEYKQAGQPQTRTPPGAAAIHSAFSTIDGALWRPFNVGLGESVSAGVWMMKEAEEGGAAMQIGIDPTGQRDLESDLIVWSDWYGPYSTDWAPNEWRLRQVHATAQTNTVSVFMRTKNDNAVQAHAHFDDFELVTSGGPIDPPVEPPTGTLGELIAKIDADVQVLDADVQALKAYVISNAVTALVV